MDLRDFHRETTCVQNRRNVALGSLHDQVVVVLINMLDLKEIVSVTLTGTKHKEAETNTKIVDRA